MKVVWLAANASHAHVSLALPLLQNACAGLAETAWAAVQTSAHDDPAAVAAAVVAQRPTVVAATLYLFNRRLVLDAVARVKALLPACVAVVGGPECLGENVTLLQRQPWVDVAVRGEGEAALPELLRRLAQAAPLSGIPGVCWRDAAGVHDDGSRAVCADWSTTPPPCGSPFFASDRPFVQVETSRGCRGHCTYCTSCGASPVRRRSLAAVRAELTELRQRGVREVRLLDRTFNDPPDRAAELLALFRGEFAEMRFHLEIDPAALPETLRGGFRAAPAGTLHVEAGVQTTAPRALAASGRASAPQAALDGLRFLVGETAVPTHVDLLAGLPGQTLADVEHDVEALLAIGPDEIQLEILKVLPGTPLQAQAAALGVRYAPVPPYEVLETPDCGAEALRLLAGWSRVLDGFYNAPPLRPACRARLREHGDFARFADGCAAAGLTTAPASLERRFRHLARLCLEVPAAQDLVRLGWMEAGLSPTDPLAGAQVWKGPVPATATWSRRRDDGEDSAGRTWRLELSTGEHWFVYDRRVSGHSPVAHAIGPRSIPDA